MQKLTTKEIGVLLPIHKPYQFVSIKWEENGIEWIPEFYYFELADDVIIHWMNTYDNLQFNDINQEYSTNEEFHIIDTKDDLFRFIIRGPHNDYVYEFYQRMIYEAIKNTAQEKIKLCSEK